MDELFDNVLTVPTMQGKSEDVSKLVTVINTFIYASIKIRSSVNKWSCTSCVWV